MPDRFLTKMLKLAAQAILGANSLETVGDDHHFSESLRRKSWDIYLMKFHCFLRGIGNSLNSLYYVRWPMALLSKSGEGRANAICS